MTPPAAADTALAPPEKVVREAQRYYKQELGHAFGLPDSSFTDGTPMSASFYNYPNTHFNEQQKNAIRNGPYGSFLV